ncbi:MAG: serine hydrolase, partial [Candidatus Eremiobacteraeota bacterium]|nr:serine hydrolase [Candidatus Eremiobacteraeota bacterium]
MFPPLLLAAALLFSAPHDSSLAALRARLERAATASGGTMGVSVLHLESGAHVAIRGGERFPMQSVYKVAIALQLLHRVERRELSLDTLVSVGASDLRLGRSPLSDSFPAGGI